MLSVMEKFRIAQYALMQTAALVYAVLTSGTIWWIFCRLHPDRADATVPSILLYDRAFATYGAFLFVVVLAWAVVVSYQSSIFSTQMIGEVPIVATGWGLVFIFLALGTYLGFLGSIVLTES